MRKTAQVVGFSGDTVWMVWSKGEIFAGNDPVFWRKDVCGAWIYRGHYGRKDSEYGWVIEHIIPLSEGGTDDVSNLTPMHWKNTVRKTDGNFECNVTSAGVHNGSPLEYKLMEIQNSASYNIVY